VVEHERRQKLFGAPVAVALILSFGVSAQTSQPNQLPPTGSPAVQSPFSARQSRDDYDRPISWKLIAPNVLSDQKAIWLFPRKVT